MPTVTATFADRLQDLIAESKKTIVEISKDTGISTGALSNYQNDKVAASITNLKTLAEYFDVPADYLLGLVDNIKRENIDVSQKYGLTDKALECLEILAKVKDMDPAIAVINVLLEQHLNGINEYHANAPQPPMESFKDLFNATSSGESVLDRICAFLNSRDPSDEYIIQLDGSLSPMSECCYEYDRGKPTLDGETIKGVRLLYVQHALDELKEQIENHQYQNILDWIAGRSK